MKREEVLTEALPYIQQFHGKTMVIKLGGHAMVDGEILEKAIKDAVLLELVGIKIVLVHGGGPEITQKMKAMGKQPKFVAGLRITDEDTLEIAQMVLGGKINSNIVSLIAKSGGKAVGISGNDGSLIVARKMTPQKVRVGEKEEEVDLGHVGEVEEINPALLHTLLENRYIPVIAPLAIARNGQSLNINADAAAGEIALALRAFKLINMTDVDGIMDRTHNNVYRHLNIGDAEKLIESGIVGEGMIPKVGSIVKAVRGGVVSGHVINGNIAHNLLLEMFTRDGVGTMISGE